MGPTGARRLLRDTFRQRIWAAMRVRRVFSIGDITSDAARGDEATARDNAKRYVRVLVAAGFLTEATRRRPGTALTSNGFKMFRLSRNTGPRAPVFSKTRRMVHDPNTREVVPCTRP